MKLVKLSRFGQASTTTTATNLNDALNGLPTYLQPFPNEGVCYVLATDDGQIVEARGHTEITLNRTLPYLVPVSFVNASAVGLLFWQLQRFSTMRTLEQENSQVIFGHNRVAHKVTKW